MMFFGDHFISMATVIILCLCLFVFLLVKNKYVRGFLATIILAGLALITAIFIKSIKRDAELKAYYVGVYLLDSVKSNKNEFLNVSHSDSVILTLESSGKFYLNHNDSILLESKGLWNVESWGPGSGGRSELIYSTGEKQNLYMDWKGSLIIRYPTTVKDSGSVRQLYFSKIPSMR
jgi:hypothetical protein